MDYCVNALLAFWMGKAKHVQNVVINNICYILNKKQMLIKAKQKHNKAYRNALSNQCSIYQSFNHDHTRKDVEGISTMQIPFNSFFEGRIIEWIWMNELSYRVEWHAAECDCSS